MATRSVRRVAPYFSHPLEVAAILTDLKLDDATIATALLHDVIEDTDATRSEIDQMFGPEIGGLVDGLTKIKRLDLVSKKAEQAEKLPQTSHRHFERYSRFFSLSSPTVCTICVRLST